MGQSVSFAGQRKQLQECTGQPIVFGRSHGGSVDDMAFSFYRRMVMSNMKGSLADDELEMS